MKFIIETARPIKPNIIRYGVLLYDDDENLLGEYELAVNVEPHIEYLFVDEQPQVKINAAGVQQEITDMVGAMQFTGMIAQGFLGLNWEALEASEMMEVEEDKVEEETKNEDISSDLPTE